MGFIFGVVVGILAGIAAVLLFVRFENTRSKQRCDLVATIAAFARMTGRFQKAASASVLPVLGRLLPATEGLFVSVRFSEFLQLEWRFDNVEASELIKASVEPVLESYRPIILSSLKFSKFTLGTVTPQFTGLCRSANQEHARDLPVMNQRGDKIHCSS